LLAVQRLENVTDQSRDRDCNKRIGLDAVRIFSSLPVPRRGYFSHAPARYSCASMLPSI